MEEPPISREIRGKGITVASLLWIVAATGTILALITQCRAAFAAIPPFSMPSHPEKFAIPLVVGWIVLGSLATWAWRKGTFDGLMARVVISTLLVSSRFAVRGSTLFQMLWPAACFGLGIVGPLLVRRGRGEERDSDRVAHGMRLFLDASITAFLVSLFADYIPRH